MNKLKSEMGATQFVFILSLFSSILMLQGCKNKNAEVDLIDLTEAMKINAKRNLSDYCDEMWYIQPEYCPEAIPGTYKNVKIVNNRLIIVDRADRIFIFDLNGKFLNYISKKGNGPGEYLHISDISSSEGNLYILNYNNAVSQYNLDGTFVKEIKLNSYHNCLDVLNEKIILYAVPPYTIHNDHHKITILSKDLEIEKLLRRSPIDPEKENEFTLHDFINIYNFNDTVSFFEKGDDKIYRICGDEVISSYEFKVPNTSNKTLKEQFDDVNYTQINYLYETPGYFYIQGIQNAKRMSLLYSKDEHKGVNLIFNLSIIDHGFHNDIDGGYPFWPRGQADTGEIFTWFDLN